MSRQQNKRTIGSSKSCVDLIFHPPPKKNSKKNAQQKGKTNHDTTRNFI